MWECNNEVRERLMEFEKAFDSIKRQSLYGIVITFCVPRKLVRFVNLCLDGTQGKVRIETVCFLVLNGFKQWDVLSPLLFSFSLEHAIRKVLVQDPRAARHYLFSGGQNTYNRVVLVRRVNVHIPASWGRRPILRYQVLQYLRYPRGCLASTIGLAAYKIY